MAAAAWFHVPGLADAVRSAASGRVPPSAALARGPFAQVIAEANAAHKAKDYAREVALYSEALATNPIADKDRRDLLGRRARAYEWGKQYPEAEADWTAALAIQPVDPSFYYRRGF